MTGRGEWKTAAASALGRAGAEALFATCRFSTEGAEHYRAFWRAGRPVIFVLWHGRLLPCTYYHRHQDLVTLVSHHRDGEYIARIVRRWGYTAVRGSSSRGGLDAARELTRAVRRGCSLALTPDGPRGPREVMKTGPLVLAQRTGAPLIPVSAAASAGWYFGGWDRFLVPRPFSAIRICYGEPVVVPSGGDAIGLAELAAEVERRLRMLMCRAHAALRSG